MFRLSHQCPLVSSSDWSCPAVGGRRLDSDVEEDAPNSPDVIQASGSGYGVTNYDDNSQSSLLSQIQPFLYKLQRQTYNYSINMVRMQPPL